MRALYSRRRALVAAGYALISGICFGIAAGICVGFALASAVGLIDAVPR